MSIAGASATLAALLSNDLTANGGLGGFSVAIMGPRDVRADLANRIGLILYRVEVDPARRRHELPRATPFSPRRDALGLELRYLLTVWGQASAEGEQVMLSRCMDAFDRNPVIAGPALAGVAERKTGNPRALMGWGHIAAGCVLLALVAAAAAPVTADMALLVAFGLLIGGQPLAFSMARARVRTEETGRALSAVNLSFFAGASVMQPLSGVAAGQGGPGAGIVVIGVSLLIAGGAFLLLTRGRRA